MIFNPYELPDINHIVTTAPTLPYAPEQLLDNWQQTLVLLMFLAADILACCPKGVMHHQMLWLSDTHNARTFESSIIIFPWLKPLLLFQCFLFFGLSVFYITDANPSDYLLHPALSEVVWRLLPTLLALLGWFLLQRWLVSWFCYLFQLEEKRIILCRAYDAAFVLFAPLFTGCYVAIAAGILSDDWAFKLLAALFILSQISFIFNGIKIFYDGFFSLLLIFVYLCTLEIAPLLIIWASLTT